MQTDRTQEDSPVKSFLELDTMLREKIRRKTMFVPE